MNHPRPKSENGQFATLPLQGQKNSYQLDAKTLSNRIFVYSLCITFIAQLVLAISVSLSTYSAHVQFAPRGESASWQIFVNVTEFAWLLFIPLLALLASRLDYTFRSFSISLLVVSGLGYLYSAFILHPLLHLHMDTFSNSPGPSVSDCCSGFGFWFREIIRSSLHVFGLGTIAVAVRYWLRSQFAERRAMKMQQSMQQLRHEVLVNRLQPHFLFNTLNSIGSLTRSQPEKSREIVGRLGDLLRSSIELTNQKDIALKTEYELVNDYLAIQKVRFGVRMNYHLDLPVELEAFRIPAFLLQPLVENSVKHGLNHSSSVQCVNIDVSTIEVDGYLRITVRDDGKGAGGVTESVANRLGLQITRERLQLQFGEQADVEISTNNGIGFTVCISIPSKVAQNDE